MIDSINDVPPKGPQIVKSNFINMQVCVPENYTDEEVREFAERENPCGTACGWQIRKEGHKYLEGYPERNPCGDRAGYVHIMLDA